MKNNDRLTNIVPTPEDENLFTVEIHNLHIVLAQAAQSWNPFPELKQFSV